MSASTIVQKTEITDLFELAPNPKFDIISSTGVTLIENSAVATKYGHVEETLNGGTNFSLTYQVGERLFLDRGVRLDFTIPIIITHTAGTIPDATTYMSATYGLQDLIYRQFGVLAGIEQAGVSFNDIQVSQTSNLASCFQMTSEYYNGAEVSKFFPASQSDRFVDYSYYNSPNATTPQTLDEDNKICRMGIPAISEENIFSGGLSNQYNSRRPCFYFISGTATQMKLLVRTSTYIPFSFFSTPNAETSLYGINRLTYSGTFYDNWIQRMFSLKGSVITAVAFDSNNAGAHKVRMNVKTYESPDYIQRAMIDTNGIPKPWRVGFNKITMQPPIQIPTISQLAGDVEIPSPQLNFGSLPKNLYIGIFGKAPASAPADVIKTPNFKGRIKGIEVTVNNSQTFIGGDAMSIFDLCKGNGLEKSYEAAMYTNGFVVKLDMSKDVSCAAQLVGASVPVNLQVKVKFSSLDGVALFRDYELRIATSSPCQLVYKDREFKTYSSLVLAGAGYDISNQAASLYARLTPQITIVGAGIWGDIWSSIKRAGKAGVDWVRNNPDKVAELLGKGIKGLLGGSNPNIPYQQNIIGGANTTQLLGAGQTKGIPYK